MMLKPFSVFLLLLALGVMGCARTQHVGTMTTDDYTFDELHQNLEGRHVDMYLRDARAIPSRALVIRPDSTWVLDELTGQVRGTPTYDITRIRYNRPGRGGMHGAVLGAVAGSIVGLAGGFGLTSLRDADQASTSLAHYVSVPTFFGTMLGFGTGMLLGVRKGSWDNYVYPDVPLNVEAAPGNAEPLADKE